MRELAEYNRGLALRANGNLADARVAFERARSSTDDKIVALANAQLGEIGAPQIVDEPKWTGYFAGRLRLRRQRGAAERARPAEQRSVESARGSARRADARFRAPAVALRCERVRRSAIPRSRFRSDRGSVGARGRASGSGSGRSSSARRSGAARSMATGSRSSSAPTCDCAVASERAAFSKRAHSTTMRMLEIRVSPTSTALADYSGYRSSMQVRLAFAPVTTSSE